MSVSCPKTRSLSDSYDWLEAIPPIGSSILIKASLDERQVVDRQDSVTRPPPSLEIQDQNSLTRLRGW